jgi:hypothetical protein
VTGQRWCTPENTLYFDRYFIVLNNLSYLIHECTLSPVLINILNQ